MKSATTNTSSANKQHTRNAGGGGLFANGGGLTTQSSLNVQQTSISQVSKIYSSSYKGGNPSNTKTAGLNSQTTLSQSPYTNGTIYNQKFRKGGYAPALPQGNHLEDLPRQISSYSVDRVANTEMKHPNFYPGSSEKVNGDLSFETNSLANNSFTLG